MIKNNPVRPEIQTLQGYTPGEQPDADRPLIKLNTNENPFPPPTVVLEALKKAVNQSLRLYPEPSSRPVREAAGRAYGLHPDQVIVGNGSDDLLTMILRTFIDPGEVVAAPAPTYSLYETLTKIQGGTYLNIPWPEDFSLPVKALVQTQAKVVFVVRPNAPTGHVVPLEQVADLCSQAPGMVILDEAYVDFAEDDGLPLLADFDNLIITRTFSKSLALAGLRVGLGFMAPSIATQMHKVRDSYNLDRLSQAGAVAALDHLSAFKPGIAAIKVQRQRLTEALNQRGFTVNESQANFVLASVPTPGRSGQGWLEALRAQGCLVRYFGSDPLLADKIRITIGTKEEIDRFIQAVDLLLE
ncbi:MAG: histidinol-phosphate transaminase [Magnetococcales bacterium]|nr:histidinol-phosphate transaminase [Magnetococcales bacterium]